MCHDRGIVAVEGGDNPTAPPTSRVSGGAAAQGVHVQGGRVPTCHLKHRNPLQLFLGGGNSPSHCRPCSCPRTPLEQLCEAVVVWVRWRPPRAAHRPLATTTTRIPNPNPNPNVGAGGAALTVRRQQPRHVPPRRRRRWLWLRLWLWLWRVGVTGRGWCVATPRRRQTPQQGHGLDLARQRPSTPLVSFPPHSTTPAAFRHRVVISVPVLVLRAVCRDPVDVGGCVGVDVGVGVAAGG